MQRFPRRRVRDFSAPGSRMKAELELRAEMKKVEAEMAQVISLVRSIDQVLNHGLTPGPGAVAEYMAWLDRVEALGLQYVNANIVTHGLRLFYQSPRRSRRRTPEPTPRMKEVKDLLETVRHNEQSNLLLLRAKRHSLENDIQHFAGERKSDGTAGPWVNGFRGRSTRSRGDARALSWIQVVVLVAALLAGSLLLDAVRPEVVRFLRTQMGLDRAASPAAAPAPGGATPAPGGAAPVPGGAARGAAGASVQPASPATPRSPR
jgi:hypothetical protein